jgi:hypothetical protein
MWANWVPSMAVPVFSTVNLGLAVAILGAGLLLLTAAWWSLAGDGVEIPRERWPGLARAMGVAGWALWIGGLLVQVTGHFGAVGVARW